MNIHVDGDGILADTVAHCLAEVGEIVTRGRIGENALLWICHTTKVDASGKPNVEEVVGLIIDAAAHGARSPIFISSCLPVGTMRRLEEHIPDRPLVYIPENIRYASPVRDFKNQERTVVGARFFDVKLNSLINEVLLPFTKQIIRTDPETAEMSKHAMNGLLALSVVYANEIARLCQCSGANAVTVMETVMAEPRVGTGLPLRPGEPYGNAHIGREVFNLNKLADDHGVRAPVIRNISVSNSL